MRGRAAEAATASVRTSGWPEAPACRNRSRPRWTWEGLHHSSRRLAAIAVFAAVVLALAGCRGHGTAQPIPPGWVRYRVDDLFTIDLPADAHRDPRPGIRIDWYPGDDDRSGDILGTAWGLRWCWWREARGAKIMFRTREGGAARGGRARRGGARGQSRRRPWWGPAREPGASFSGGAALCPKAGRGGRSRIPGPP